LFLIAALIAHLQRGVLAVLFAIAKFRKAGTNVKHIFAATILVGR
jgi:hypothetical protein